MYKSYATKNPIENTTVAISSFVPAKVDIDVNISGFATSYSYAKGIDGVAQSIATANSKSNDWMDDGKAVCTITKSGIPSTLLSVKSVSMLVNGEEYSKDYTDDGNNTFTLHKTAHTKWEQKNVSVKVVYSTPDGLEFEGTSNTLTRHITGLPYAANPPKNSGDNAWCRNGNTAQSTIKWDSDNVKLSGISQSPSINSPSFNIPANVDITIKSDVKAEKYTFIKEIKTIYKVYVNSTEVSSKQGSFSRTVLLANTSFSSGSNSLKCESTYGATGPSVQIYSVSILYR